MIQLRLQNASLNAFTPADERAFLVNLAHALGVQSQQVRMDCMRSGHVCWTLPWLPSLTNTQPGQDSLQEKDKWSLLLEKLRRYFMCQFLPVFTSQQFRDKERCSDRLPFLESIEPSPELLFESRIPTPDPRLSYLNPSLPPWSSERVRLGLAADCCRAGVWQRPPNPSLDPVGWSRSAPLYCCDAADCSQHRESRPSLRAIRRHPCARSRATRWGPPRS